MDREHVIAGPDQGEPPLRAQAIEVEAFKAGSFGRIAPMCDADGPFVRRDLSASPWWLRFPAWCLARREALALRQLACGSALANRYIAS